MEDRTPIWIGAVAGAIIGGAVGYLLFTEKGRRLRADLEPHVLDLITELRRAKDAASVARDTLSDARAPVRGPDAVPRSGAPASSPGWR